MLTSKTNLGYVKQVCLFRWDFMINYNKNEEVNEKLNHNATWIELDQNMVTNILYIKCVYG